MARFFNHDRAGQCTKVKRDQIYNKCYCIVCLFVLDPYPHLSRGVNSRGRTYGEAPLPPRPLVTPGPRCSSCSLSPHTYCHASCIRSVPSPVLLSYTDILPSIWSAPSLSSCPTHINNPHTYEPLKTHI